MRYPGATWQPFPENATQPKIRPTQVIHHVTSSTGAISGTWKYFALETVGVESHFGVDYTDVAWQGIDDETRADANLLANKRPDGTGAISVETRGGEFGTWTNWQIDWLVAHGVWCHEQHGIPLRICRTPDDPGFGYHTLFGAPSAWTPVAKTCPGPHRITQWKTIVFPRIEAKDVPDMDLTDANLVAIGKAVWDNNVVDKVRDDIPDTPDGTPRDAQAFLQKLRTDLDVVGGSVSEILALLQAAGGAHVHTEIHVPGELEG